MLPSLVQHTHVITEDTIEPKDSDFAWPQSSHHSNEVKYERSVSIKACVRAVE